jgi:hypothetical protein
MRIVDDTSTHVFRLVRVSLIEVLAVSLLADILIFVLLNLEILCYF